MKRIILLAFIVLLIGCSKETSETSELDRFIDKYNESITEGLQLISTESFGATTKEKTGYWQVIHTEEIAGSEIAIYSKKDFDDNLIGYYMDIEGDLEYGIVSSEAIVKALGLEIKQYQSEMNSFLETDELSADYIDGDYEITFIDFRDTTNTIVINYDKTSQ